MNYYILKINSKTLKNFKIKINNFRNILNGIEFSTLDNENSIKQKDYFRNEIEKIQKTKKVIFENLIKDKDSFLYGENNKNANRFFSKDVSFLDLVNYFGFENIKIKHIKENIEENYINIKNVVLNNLHTNKNKNLKEKDENNKVEEFKKEMNKNYFYMVYSEFINNELIKENAMYPFSIDLLSSLKLNLYQNTFDFNNKEILENYEKVAFNNGFCFDQQRKKLILPIENILNLDINNLKIETFNEKENVNTKNYNIKEKTVNYSVVGNEKYFVEFCNYLFYSLKNKYLSFEKSADYKNLFNIECDKILSLLNDTFFKKMFYYENNFYENDKKNLNKEYFEYVMYVLGRILYKNEFSYLRNEIKENKENVVKRFLKYKYFSLNYKFKSIYEKNLNYYDFKNYNYSDSFQIPIIKGFGEFEKINETQNFNKFEYKGEFYFLENNVIVDFKNEKSINSIKAKEIQKKYENYKLDENLIEIKDKEIIKIEKSLFSASNANQYLRLNIQSLLKDVEFLKGRKEKENLLGLYDKRFYNNNKKEIKEIEKTNEKMEEKIKKINFFLNEKEIFEKYLIILFVEKYLKTRNIIIPHTTLANFMESDFKIKNNIEEQILEAVKNGLERYNEKEFSKFKKKILIEENEERISYSKEIYRLNGYYFEIDPIKYNIVPKKMKILDIVKSFVFKELIDELRPFFIGILEDGKIKKKQLKLNDKEILLKLYDFKSKQINELIEILNNLYIKQNSSEYFKYFEKVKKMININIEEKKEKMKEYQKEIITKNDNFLKINDLYYIKPLRKSIEEFKRKIIDYSLNFKIKNKNKKNNSLDFVTIDNIYNVINKYSDYYINPEEVKKLYDKKYKKDGFLPIDKDYLFIKCFESLYKNSAFVIPVKINLTETDKKITIAFLKDVKDVEYFVKNKISKVNDFNILKDKYKIFRHLPNEKRKMIFLNSEKEKEYKDVNYTEYLEYKYKNKMTLHKVNPFELTQEDIRRFKNIYRYYRILDENIKYLSFTLGLKNDKLFLQFKSRLYKNNKEFLNYLYMFEGVKLNVLKGLRKLGKDITKLNIEFKNFDTNEEKFDLYVNDKLIKKGISFKNEYNKNSFQKENVVDKITKILLKFE